MNESSSINIARNWGTAGGEMLFFDGWYATEGLAREVLAYCCERGARPVGLGIVQDAGCYSVIYWSYCVIFPEHVVDHRNPAALLPGDKLSHFIIDALNWRSL